MSIKVSTICLVKSILDKSIECEIKENFTFIDNGSTVQINKDASIFAKKVYRIVKKINNYINIKTKRKEALFIKNQRKVTSIFDGSASCKEWDCYSPMMIALSLMRKCLESNTSLPFNKEDIDFLTQQEFEYIAKKELNKEYSFLVRKDVLNIDFVNNSSKLGDILYRRAENG